ncbi:WD40 domain-containing protein [Limnoraphis robusta]|uniref:WD40 domain-containing protein n=1 Tax=Limnoraphis robusta TaxID=1118279 RepID=UPI002B1EFD7E|nr:NB-ARC domain-containing protein [Limnoraphis robusta]MEA5499122.1 NB-ARC domain-containing protein [Limnoraphis robusta BA-68 BA1]
MPRPNYGPQSKKRTKRLLEVLITYANGELEKCDRYESQIQVNWQTEKQLVVRTKVRYLEALTAEIGTGEKLNGTQLKESLKSLQDFIEILEDNRSSTQGSDSWHFTLKLWHHRRDTAANLAEFEQQWEQRRSPKSKQSTGEISSTQSPEILPNHNITINKISRQDWGEAPNCAEFYDRETELSTLKNWILEQRCQLVTVLGMGGMGKTALSVKLAQQIQGEFSELIWRSLRNAPPLEKLLTELIQFLSNEQLTPVAKTVDEQISTLIQCLQNSRFLIILDNVESILDSKKRAGSYREGYERYGQLFRSIGETQHQSCLLLTSREKPRGIGYREGNNQPIRSLQLEGLKSEAGQDIFREKGFEIAAEDANILIESYSGNPLALKIVSTTIAELFEGDVAQFLAEGTVIFGDIADLLDQQFARLSSLEQQVMYWLAIHQEWMSLSQLKQGLLTAISQRDLLEALESLQQRSLIEKQSAQFTQQPVVMEYITAQLIEQVFEEITTGEINLFDTHALIEATTKDYLRTAQIRLILKPLSEKLLTLFSHPEAVYQCLTQLLDKLRSRFPQKRGYAAGNLLNLLIELKLPINDLDFSNLTVWQAYLQGVNLHQVNFDHADLNQCVFTQTVGGVLSIALSPNGELLATGIDEDIFFWQINEGRPLSILPGHKAWVMAVSFSPDGNILASGSNDQTVRLWDVKTGQCLKTLRGHNSRVQCLAFSEDGKLIASGSNDKTVRVWDVETGECLQVLQGHYRRILAITFNLKRGIIISSSEDETVRFWEIATGNCVNILETQVNWMSSMALSPDGELLVTASDGNTVKFWEIETGKCTKNLVGYEERVWAVAFSPDGEKLATGSNDNTIKIWNVCTGECVKTLQEHRHLVWWVGFSLDNQTLVSVSQDQSVKFWHFASGQCLKTLDAYSNWVSFVIFSPDGKILVSCSEDRLVRLWNINTKTCEKTLIGHTNIVSSAAFHPNGNLLATASDDSTVKLWDVTTGECLKTLWGHESWVHSVSFSCQGLLATGSRDKTIKIWDIETGECLQTLAGHWHRVKSVAFSFCGKILASGSDDQTLKIWDVEKGICLQTLSEHTDWVLCVAFSPCGKILASAGGDRTVKLWEVETGKCVLTLTGHRQRVRSVAFNNDGSQIVSSSDDHTVKVWNLQTGNCVYTCHEHRQTVWSVACCPDGKTFVSGGDDQTIKLWEMKTGKCLGTMILARPYEGMKMTGAIGLTSAQKVALKALGAVEE